MISHRRSDLDSRVVRGVSRTARGVFRAARRGSCARPRPCGEL